jgi:AmmeMemoRadiSam system protein B
MMLKYMPLIIILLNPFSYLDIRTEKMDISSSEMYEVVDLKGMIVPHHLVPIDKLSKMYATASSDAVEHVFLMSPDHFTNSDQVGITTLKGFKGSFGVIDNHDTYSLGLSELFPSIMDEQIRVEHGLSAHLPFIKEYFPTAKLSVLAIPKTVSKSQLDELIAWIPEDSFFVASVDFSHYLSLDEANEKDHETLEMIENKRYLDFFGMSDAYFDTPGTLYTIFSWALNRGYDYQVYDHSNSALYFGRHAQETTSYYFIGFKEK